MKMKRIPPHQECLVEAIPGPAVPLSPFRKRVMQAELIALPQLKESSQKFSKKNRTLSKYLIFWTESNYIQAHP